MENDIKINIEELSNSFSETKSTKSSIDLRAETNTYSYCLFTSITLAIFVVILFIFVNGDTWKIYYPTNSDGQICGVEGMKGKPNLYLMNVAPCVVMGSYMSVYGCPTHSICVHECMNQIKIEAFGEPYLYALIRKKPINYSAILPTKAVGMYCHRTNVSYELEKTTTNDHINEFNETQAKNFAAFYKRYLDESRWRYNIVNDLEDNMIVINIICMIITGFIVFLVILWTIQPVIVCLIMSVVYTSLVLHIIMKITYAIVEGQSITRREEYLEFIDLHDLFKIHYMGYVALWLFFVTRLVQFIVTLVGLFKRRKILLNFLELTFECFLGVRQLQTIPISMALYFTMFMIVLWRAFVNLSTFSYKKFIKKNPLDVKVMEASQEMVHVINKDMEKDVAECTPYFDNHCFFVDYEVHPWAIVCGGILVLWFFLFYSIIVQITRSIVSGIIIYRQKQPKTLEEIHSQILLGVYGRMVRYHVGNFVLASWLEVFYVLYRLPYSYNFYKGKGVLDKNIVMSAHVVSMKYGCSYLQGVKYAHNLNYRRSCIENIEGPSDSIIIHIRTFGVFISIIAIYYVSNSLKEPNDIVFLCIVGGLIVFLFTGIITSSLVGIIYTIPFLLRDEMEQNSGKLVSKECKEIYKFIFKKYEIK